MELEQAVEYALSAGVAQIPNAPAGATLGECPTAHPHPPRPGGGDLVTQGLTNRRIAGALRIGAHGGSSRLEHPEEVQLSSREQVAFRLNEP